ncbi:MAG: hypothetical protein CSYNP_03551 [Syntrophus sp. SKADARSKE-3]|nr:hypothetical protein [Syntrophus sp. SKADARSKE-3]
MKHFIDHLRRRAKYLKRETYALYLAYHDPRVPWYAKLVCVCIVGYALSPIDLIPDFIPIIGYLDDLIIVPAGIALAIKLIPEEVMCECRCKVEKGMNGKGPRNYVAAAIIVTIWLGLILLLVMLIYSAFHKS